MSACTWTTYTKWWPFLNGSACERQIIIFFPQEEVPAPNNFILYSIVSLSTKYECLYHETYNVHQIAP